MRVSITPPYKRRRMERERKAWIAGVLASVPDAARDLVVSHAQQCATPLIRGVSLRVGGVLVHSNKIRDSRECGHE